MPAKERLDKLMVDSGLVETRSRAQTLIMAGKVHVIEYFTVRKPPIHERKPQIHVRKPSLKIDRFME